MNAIKLAIAVFIVLCGGCVTGNYATQQRIASAPVVEGCSAKRVRIVVGTRTYTRLCA